MLPREVETVFGLTGLPGKSSVKRFKQSWGLDTALYKNFPLPFLTEHPHQRQSHTTKVFPSRDWRNANPTYRSTQVDKTVSLLRVLSIQVYLQLFPSMSHPHYRRLLQTYSQSMSAENIFSLYHNMVRYYCQAICVQYNSFWSMSFVQIFLHISSTTAINNNGIKALPCVRPTFTLDSPDTPGPPSTLLFVSSYVPSTNLTSASGTHVHFSVHIVISLGIVV